MTNHDLKTLHSVLLLSICVAVVSACSLINPDPTAVPTPTVQSISIATPIPAGPPTATPAPTPTPAAVTIINPRSENVLVQTLLVRPDPDSDRIQLEIWVNPGKWGISAAEVELVIDESFPPALSVRLGDFFGDQDVLVARSEVRESGRRVHIVAAATGDTAAPSDPGVFAIINLESGPAVRSTLPVGAYVVVRLVNQDLLELSGTRVELR